MFHLLSAFLTNSLVNSMSILYSDFKIALEETPLCNFKLSLNQTVRKYNPGRECINIRYLNLLHANFD